MVSLCIVPVFVPKVAPGERAVVPKVELGEQRVKRPVIELIRPSKNSLLLFHHYQSHYRRVSSYNSLKERA